MALKDFFRLPPWLRPPNRKAAPPEPGRNTQPSSAPAKDGINASLEEIQRLAANPDEPAAARIRALSILGQFNYELGRLGKAKTFYRTAVDLTQASGGAEYATCLNNLAAIQKALGELSEAEAAMLKSIDVQSRLPGQDDSEMVMRWNNLAALYQDQGKMDASEQAYLKAIGLFRADGSISVELRATTLNNLAQVYFATGKLEEAEKLMLDALKLRRDEAVRQPAHYANSLMTVAMLYQSTGRTKEALPLLTDALEIIRAVRGEDHPDYATALNNLAILCEEEGAGSGSEEIFVRAQKIFVNALGERHPLYQTALNNLAEYYRRTRNFDDAVSLHEGVIQRRREKLGDNHPDTLVSIENLVASYLDSQQFTLAKDLLPGLLSGRRAVFGEEHPEYTQSVMLLARTCYGLGEYQEAFRHASDAMSLEERWIGRILQESDEERRIRLTSLVRESWNFLLSLIATQKLADKSQLSRALDLVLRRKGLSAAAIGIQQEMILAGKYPELKPDLARLARQREAIAQATMEGLKEPYLAAMKNLRMSLLREKCLELERDLARKIPEMQVFSELQSVNVRSIANELTESAVLVEFVQFSESTAKIRIDGPEDGPERLAAFVLMRDGEEPLVDFVDLGAVDAIERRVREFLAYVVPGRRESEFDFTAGPPIGTAKRDLSIQETGCALRSLALDGVRQKLSGRRCIFLSPDGAVCSLPFGVLPLNDREYVFDELDISYLAVGRDLLRWKQPLKAAGPSIVIGNPAFDLERDGEDEGISSESAPNEARRGFGVSFVPLPNSAEEARRVGKKLGVEPWIGRDATRERLKRECHSPRVLHIATHGFFLMRPRETRSWLGNPMVRSGLAFAGARTWLGSIWASEEENGLLTSEEVLGLDLSGSELTVLSACDSARGDAVPGEGVFGLRRAFIVAGSQTLIMSCWPILDAVTSELMDEFYERLLEGKGRAAALRLAQEKIKKEYPDPYYWGSFVCLGHPGPLATQIRLPLDEAF